MSPSSPSIRAPVALSLLGLVGALTLSPATAVAQDPSGDAEARAEVLAVTEAALEHISNEDMVALTDLMIEGAAVASVRVDPRSGAVSSGIRYRADERANTPTADLVERGFDPEVMISGPMAMVWLPYDFYSDGAWSHCGVDIFTLFRLDEGWRIATISYTVEQPPACRRHPDGPPGGMTGPAGG